MTRRVAPSAKPCQPGRESAEAKLEEDRGGVKVSKKKGDPGKVHPTMAMDALREAKGDRKGAYTQCVVRSFRTTGRMAPGFDNADLQAWYDQNLPKEDPR